MQIVWAGDSWLAISVKWGTKIVGCGAPPERKSAAWDHAPSSRTVMNRSNSKQNRKHDKQLAVKARYTDSTHYYNENRTQETETKVQA